MTASTNPTAKPTGPSSPARISRVMSPHTRNAVTARPASAWLRPAREPDTAPAAVDTVPATSGVSAPVEREQQPAQQCRCAQERDLDLEHAVGESPPDQEGDEDGGRSDRARRRGARAPARERRLIEGGGREVEAHA